VKGTLRKNLRGLRVGDVGKGERSGGGGGGVSGKKGTGMRGITKRGLPHEYYRGIWISRKGLRGPQRGKGGPWGGGNWVYNFLALGGSGL